MDGWTDGWVNEDEDAVVAAAAAAVTRAWAVRSTGPGRYAIELNDGKRQKVTSRRQRELEKDSPDRPTTQAGGGRLAASRLVTEGVPFAREEWGYWAGFRSGG